MLQLKIKPIQLGLKQILQIDSKSFSQKLDFKDGSPLLGSLNFEDINHERKAYLSTFFIHHEFILGHYMFALYWLSQRNKKQDLPNCRKKQGFTDVLLIILAITK
jgi:hypothetical protein